MENAKKLSGGFATGTVNTSLGKPNPKPAPVNTRSKTLKGKVPPVSTRLPINSSRGEIANHKGL